MPYYQIRAVNEEPEGIFRYIDEHTFEKRVKKSIYYVVYLQKGCEKELVPVEISFNMSTKAAMMAIKTTTDSKLQRS